MMSAQKSVLLALVTVPDRRTARRLARAALEARLVACANLVPGLESHYWWKGKQERATEVLMLFKTTSRHQRALEQLIVQIHPYDTPEFILLDVRRANA